MNDGAPRFLFVPVSGPFGMGEYARSLAIAKGARARWPDAAIRFVLSREAPYAASTPFPVTLLDSSPTFHSAAVSALLAEWQPDVVIFDNAGRTAQLRAATRCGARVVYISARRRQRRKAFRLRWMRRIDEHWIAYPEFIAGALGIVERLKLEVMRRPTVRYLDVVLDSLREPKHGSLLSRTGGAAGEFALVVPGGGTGHPGALDAVALFLTAARGLAAAGIETIFVGPAGDEAMAAVNAIEAPPSVTGVAAVEAVDAVAARGAMETVELVEAPPPVTGVAAVEAVDAVAARGAMETVELVEAPPPVRGGAAVEAVDAVSARGPTEAVEVVEAPPSVTGVAAVEAVDAVAARGAMETVEVVEAPTSVTAAAAVEAVDAVAVGEAVEAAVAVSAVAAHGVSAVGKLRMVGALSQADLAALMRAARLIVANGGSTLIQSLACGKPCLAVPVAGDQSERIGRCVAAGAAVAARLDAAAILAGALALWRDEQQLEALAGRAVALGLCDGIDVAVRALAALLTGATSAEAQGTRRQ